jgi:flavin reductase (DIM6/NTAB) family NADH-FMN oxidoreductase RutF
MTVTSIVSTLDPQLLRRAFGAFPSGVVAVAAEVDGVKTGLAASSFTSVSMDPALVSFSVANTSTTWPVLRGASHLGLSVLADHHGEVCRQLAGPADHRFDDLATTRTDAGAVLLDDAVATFDCTLHQEVAAGDHTIVLLALHAVEDRGLALPLVFHRSAFGRLADSA